MASAAPRSPIHLTSTSAESHFQAQLGRLQHTRASGAVIRGEDLGDRSPSSDLRSDLSSTLSYTTARCWGDSRGIEHPAVQDSEVPIQDIRIRRYKYKYNHIARTSVPLQMSVRAEYLFCGLACFDLAVISEQLPQRGLVPMYECPQRAARSIPSAEIAPFGTRRYWYLRIPTLLAAFLRTPAGCWY